MAAGELETSWTARRDRENHELQAKQTAAARDIQGKALCYLAAPACPPGHRSAAFAELLQSHLARLIEAALEVTHDLERFDRYKTIERAILLAWRQEIIRAQPIQTAAARDIQGKALCYWQCLPFARRRSPIGFVDHITEHAANRAA